MPEIRNFLRFPNTHGVWKITKIPYGTLIVGSFFLKYDTFSSNYPNSYILLKCNHGYGKRIDFKAVN